MKKFFKVILISFAAVAVYVLALFSVAMQDFVREPKGVSYNTQRTITLKGTSSSTGNGIFATNSFLEYVPPPKNEEVGFGSGGALMSEDGSAPITLILGEGYVEDDVTLGIIKTDVEAHNDVPTEYDGESGNPAGSLPDQVVTTLKKADPKENQGEVEVDLVAKLIKGLSKGLAAENAVQGEFAKSFLARVKLCGVHPVRDWSLFGMVTAGIAESSKYLAPTAMLTSKSKALFEALEYAPCGEKDKNLKHAQNGEGGEELEDYDEHTKHKTSFWGRVYVLYITR